MIFFHCSYEQSGIHKFEVVCICHLMNFWNVLLGHKASERGGMGREGGGKRSRGEEEENEGGKKEV